MKTAKPAKRSDDDARLLTGIGIVVLLLLFLASLHTFVMVETYELAAFEAYRSCTDRRLDGCDDLLPPWADKDERRTLRARFQAAFVELPELTLDAAGAARDAASGALDAITQTESSEGA